MSAAPFRTRYLHHEELTQVLREWERTYPSLVRLTCIGKSPEGRELLIAEIGPDPDRKRPAAWVDGNMHAVELCGSSVALAIAEDLLALHGGAPLPAAHPAADLPAHVQSSLRDTLLYVMPRMCPDGAETILRSERYVRSNARDGRLHTPTPRWERGDVDGDGRVLLMRRQDPQGEYVEHATVPGLMRPRTLEDAGPFFKVWPEGTIANFDGTHVPSPHYLSDNDVDLNRNFPFDWRPEHEQLGAGHYPTSEPETRAVVDFHTRHPNVFAWLNLHTYGGVYIRPLGDGPDKKMDPSDLAIYRLVETFCETYGGYPMVSGFEEFLYEPDKPLRGDLIEFAYQQHGCLAYVCELWDIFHRLGIPRKKPFTDHYDQLEEEHLLALYEFDRKMNAGRMFSSWRSFRHPQLGDVELGGVAPVVGLYNPPYELIDEVCRRQSAHFFRVMALSPRLSLEVVSTERSADSTRLTVRIDNLGYLPTYVLSSAKKLALDARLFLEVHPLDATVTVAPSEARHEVGHLEGWGQGRHHPSVFVPTSRGTVSSRTLTVTARGTGRVALRASGLRMGSAERVVEL